MKRRSTAEILNDPEIQWVSDEDLVLVGEERNTQEVPATRIVTPTANRLPVDEGVRALFERVRTRPLDADGYRALADYFEEQEDPSRSGLMSEVAQAIEGDPDAAPLPPKFTLPSADRVLLLHPVLRSEAGELLREVGGALCQLYASTSRVKATQPFRTDAGRGAPIAANALLSAVRMLGQRVSEPYISEENHPLFCACLGRTPRLLVGRAAVKKAWFEPVLRFHAGRALFGLNPSLVALRVLQPRVLMSGFDVLGRVLHGKRMDEEASRLRALLGASRIPALQALHESARSQLNAEILMDAAKHSANRAGLLVCGGVAPALSALKGEQASYNDLEQLVRFAASERYLTLRSRRH